jgi:hypothetical protein
VRHEAEGIGRLAERRHHAHPVTRSPLAIRYTSRWRSLLLAVDASHRPSLCFQPGKRQSERRLLPKSSQAPAVLNDGLDA